MGLALMFILGALSGATVIITIVVLLEDRE